jgi:hypothetical protein
LLDGLEIGEVHAEAIIEKAIEFGVYTDDMPSTSKDKIEAAHEIVAFGIDSWIDDEVTPEAEDDQARTAGEQIAAIFELAGVTIEGKGKSAEIVYGDLPELDGADGGDGDDNAGDGSAFDIESVIEGYPELTPATRIKKIKALELDPEDDDDYNTLISLAEWEESQDEPSSRVLNYLNEIVPPEGEGDGDAEGDRTDADGDQQPYTEDELTEMGKDDLAKVASEVGVDFPQRLTDAGRKRVVAAILEAQVEGGSEEDEPWDGYLEADEEAILEVVNDDDRTEEELDYILTFENSLEEPREEITSRIEERLEELRGGGEAEPAKEERPSRRARRASSSDPDESTDAEDAKARDDEKETRRASKNGKTVTLTREQILEALTEGSVTITL